MAFFDKLGEMAKNIGDKTGEAIETTKLSAKISSEKSAAAAELENIGRFYYERFTQCGEAAPEVLEYCNAAKAHYDAAAEAQAEIERIKAEGEGKRVMPAPSGVICPECKTANAAGTKFCQNCGARLDIPAPAGTICSQCGAQNTPGTKFCCQCGAKLEAPAEPAKSVCPSCGAQAAAGVKFCPECGERLEP